MSVTCEFADENKCVIVVGFVCFLFCFFWGEGVKIVGKDQSDILALNRVALNKCRFVTTMKLTQTLAYWVKLILHSAGSTENWNFSEGMRARARARVCVCVYVYVRMCMCVKDF